VRCTYTLTSNNLRDKMERSVGLDKINGLLIDEQMFLCWLGDGTCLPNQSSATDDSRCFLQGIRTSVFIVGKELRG
jgi:hypothetical protein